MPKTVTALGDIHPQMLRVSGESDCKKVAVGQSIRRALEVLGVSQKDAAFQMGYSDQGTVSRWCAGTERPHFDKLFELGGFETAWVKVRALGNPQMAVETVIRITEVA